MCQLGAVLVSDKRVYRADGVRRHEALRGRVAAEYPGEVFAEAEYDFANRRWGYGGTEDEALRLLTETQRENLRRFSAEAWGDADALMRFCETAGPPETPLLNVSARRAYDEACAAALRVYEEAIAPAQRACDEAIVPAKRVYEEAIAPAQRVYDEACAAAWRACDEARSAAWSVYDEAIVPAKRACDEAIAPAKRAYEEAIAPAWSVYGEARAAAQRVYEEACYFAWFRLFSEPANRISAWK
jgi:hypothetical protein